jgi:hypothetical protein
MHAPGGDQLLLLHNKINRMELTLDIRALLLQHIQEPDAVRRELGQSKED